MARQDAADLAWRQSTDDWAGTRNRYECLQPYVLSAIGLPSAIVRQGEGKIPVEISTRCRQCENCLMHRRRLWTARAIDELKASSRTWFGTLTVEPFQRYRHVAIAQRDAEIAGHGLWSDIEPHDQFAFVCGAIGPEITKWLKRVRKVSGAALRYLLVTEAHKDGFPHFHIMLHEQALPVTKRLLEDQWRLGFSHWRLVEQHDARSAYYACKYLSKDNMTRVRASVRYGRAHLVSRSTERLERATRLIAGNPQPVTSDSVGPPEGSEWKGLLGL